ncbi:MAG: hypothetical protein ACLUGD_10865, partial [Ruminococcus sp.]
MHAPLCGIFRPNSV